MGALSPNERLAVWRALMRYWSARSIPIALPKHELYHQSFNTGVLAYLDNWLESHSGITTDATGLEGAIPPKQVRALGAEALADVLFAVVAMRADPSGATLARAWEIE